MSPIEQHGNRRAPRVLFLATAVVAVTVAHFTVGGTTHGFHVVHIILAGAYLVPIVAASVWFGRRGGLLTTAVVSLAYYMHIRLSWPDQPMENANQMAMIAVFWVLGIVAGSLEDLQERERRRRLAAERQAEREAVIEGIAGLSNALRARDEYTREHSEHVSRLAVAIGRYRGLTSDRLDLLRLAGLVHDIGKIGVRDDVLLKPHELTAEEHTAMERHPAVAAEILRPIHGAREIAEIVLAHHECPDGSGYPRGCRGDEIPLEAHIIRVADVFASIIERRPYKPAIESGVAIEMMRESSGTKLDSESLRALEQILRERGAL